MNSERYHGHYRQLDDAGIPPAPFKVYPDGIPIEVCDKFIDLAREAKATGLRHFSADAILHRIRWHFVIDQRRGNWKCNNNWTATLGRWAMAEHRDLAGFFETRASPQKGVTIDE